MKYFTLLLIFIFNHSTSQVLYERKWGAVLPVYNKIKQPFNPARTIKSTPFVAEVNPATGDLYLVNPEENELNVYNTENSDARVFFKFEGAQPTYIENIKFDSKNNVIITGRTFNPDLATSGAYNTYMSDSYSGCWFVAKIDAQGTLVWFTYFHEITQNTSHLSIDQYDNIYILNKRSKTTVLQSDAFQERADEKSTIEFQDAISKLDKDGKHVWSTFYAHDQSKLLALEAGTEGIFIYGVHFTLTPSGTFFGTPGAFQESITSSGNASAVFISKFSFDGTRLWSTYFGGQKTFAPLANSYISKNSSPLAVIGDEVYFITMHSPNNAAYKDQATKGAYRPVFNGSGMGRTISCFSGKGSRKWTSYIETGDMLRKALDGTQLFLSSTADPLKNPVNINTTPNAYQQTPGGLNDVLTSVLSTDGSQLTYTSWYGFKGNDSGITLPTINGYYVLGFSQNNKAAETSFADAATLQNQFTRKEEDYLGNFIGCFIKKRTEQIHK